MGEGIQNSVESNIAQEKQSVSFGVSSKEKNCMNKRNSFETMMPQVHEGSFSMSLGYEQTSMHGSNKERSDQGMSFATPNFIGLHTCHDGTTVDGVMHGNVSLFTKHNGMHENNQAEDFQDIDSLQETHEKSFVQGCDHVENGRSKENSRSYKTNPMIEDNHSDDILVFDKARGIFVESKKEKTSKHKSCYHVDVSEVGNFNQHVKIDDKMAHEGRGKGSIAESLFHEYQSLSQRVGFIISNDQGCKDKEIMNHASSKDFLLSNEEVLGVLGEHSIHDVNSTKDQACQDKEALGVHEEGVSTNENIKSDIVVCNKTLENAMKRLGEKGKKKKFLSMNSMLMNYDSNKTTSSQVEKRSAQEKVFKDVTNDSSLGAKIISMEKKDANIAFMSGKHARPKKLPARFRE